MSSLSLTFSSQRGCEPALEAAVESGLDEFNASEAVFLGQSLLSSCARDSQGHIVGGAIGRTLGTCCELKLLWVSHEFREQGVGKELLRRFEELATSRGCDTFYLTTFSFQAPRFYEASGYSVKLEIPGHGAAGSKFYMVKFESRETAA